LPCETRSAHKVGFIREKEKAALETDREPGKSVAPCYLHRVFFIWSFLLRRGVRSLLIYLCRNRYTVLRKPPCGILRHPQGAMTLQDVGLTVLSWGMGALAHFVF
jgi:hypothetical protein